MKSAIAAPFISVILLLAASDVYGTEGEFANYGELTLVGQPQPGQLSWSGAYSDQVWEWLVREEGPLPGWNVNATQVAEMQFTSEFLVDEDFLLTGSFATKTTVTAREEGAIVGTLVLNEVAEQGLIDLNASRAIVDNAAGTIRLRSGSPLNDGRAITEVTLADATGIFSDIEQVGSWEGYYSGYYVKPLLPDTDLQQNILEAPFVGAYFETVLTGSYAQIPEPSGILLVTLGAVGACQLCRRSRSKKVGIFEPRLGSDSCHFGPSHKLPRPDVAGCCRTRAIDSVALFVQPIGSDVFFPPTNSDRQFSRP